jgi:hypothetical protein
MYFAARTFFRRSRGRRVSFSCFAFLDTFLAILRALGPVLMFCAPGLIFGETEGVGSHFHVVRSRTHFRRCGGRLVPFSCFVLPYSFSAVPRKSGNVFKFCAPGLIFDGTEGVQFSFHVLLSRTCFRRCQVRRVPFSCFVRPNSFSSVPRATGPVLMFCAPGLVSGGTEGVGSRFHVLRS